jgi:cellulose synthase/poly-beta-1,6-N-acetylglucosamine synthase-like glycosyltransferase
MLSLVLGSLLALLYVWVGYPLIVVLLARLKSYARDSLPGRILLPVSIVISARNEEDKIAARIENLLAQNYPEAFEIIICSDGSTDRTAEVARQYMHHAVTVLEFAENCGKAIVHNRVIPLCKYEIVVFTDAGTIFEENFLQMLVCHFTDPGVGAVIGSIHYSNKVQTGISESAGFYWKYEEIIRRAENAVGLLASGTGACMALRKSLFTPMKPFEDVDYAMTIEIAFSNYRVVYEPRAQAYDKISENATAALKTRIRQTSKSFVSILSRSCRRRSMLNLPLLLAILSHKTGRHLTPFLMVVLFISSVVGYASFNLVKAIFWLQMLYALLVIIGYAQRKRWPRLRVASFAFTFFLLNLSRFMGVLLAVCGMRPSSYSTEY